MTTEHGDFQQPAYDSRPDTYAHIAEVRDSLICVAFDILDRANIHDNSKLSEPELLQRDPHHADLGMVQADRARHQAHEPRHARPHRTRRPRPTQAVAMILRLTNLVCKQCGQRIMLPDRPPWLVCGCPPRREVARAR